MKMPKSSTLIAAGAIALGLTVTGIGVTYAATGSTGTGNNPMSNLVTAISQKFNLNQSDVQKVFDEQHAQMEVQHEQAFKDRLAQAVTDGKLTQDQSDKIVAKMAELKSQRDADKATFASLTQAERQAKMQARAAELKQWAIDNNIPADFSPFNMGGRGPGMGKGMGRMMHGGRGQDNDDDDAQTPAAASTTTNN